MSSKKAIAGLLGLADIQLNGQRPFDVQVHDDRFYDRVLRQQELGLGESYMDGWWSAKKLDQTITRLLTANVKNNSKQTRLS
jgi:cyclopropane-fatty-acyl-phospholipid synthase